MWRVALDGFANSIVDSRRLEPAGSLLWVHN
jgi:hypothetical protein